MLGGRGGDVGPDRAGLDARPPGCRVDGDGAHAVGPQQDRAGQRAFEVVGVVAGALRRDAQPTLAGEVDDGRDVGGALRQRDGRRPLVDGEVPSLARLVPAGVAGGDDRSVDGRVETAEVACGEFCVALLRGLDVGRHRCPFRLRDSAESFASGLGLYGEQVSGCG